jgi:putative membrane protein
VKAWVWETGGPYFGIPIQNYFGWLLTTFTVYLAYRVLERRWGQGGIGREVGPERDRGPGAAASPLSRAAAAMPVAAYGLMLVANLLSGVAPAGLVVIGPVVMGIPFAVAAWRLGNLAGDRMRDATATPAPGGTVIGVLDRCRHFLSRITLTTAGGGGNGDTRSR